MMSRAFLAATLLLCLLAASCGQEPECMQHGEQCKWKNAGGAGKACCNTADGESTSCVQAINPSGNGGQYYCMLDRCLA